MSTGTLRGTYVQRDYKTLSQHTDAEINDKATRITLHINYPDGWHPGTGDLLLRYPDPYPRMQPMVLIPKDMEYEGRVTHLLKATEELRDNWIQWCTHYLDWETFWKSAKRKERPPIMEFLGLIHESLQHPNKSDPINHAQRKR